MADEPIPLRGVTGRAAPVPATGGLPSALATAFSVENPVVSLVGRLNEEEYPPDPSHNPLDIIKGTTYLDRHADNFAYSRSERETRAIMARIDRENAANEALDASGASGTVARIFAGSIDPTLFLPGGAVVRGVRGGYSALRTARAAAIAGAVQSTISESTLQATQETRTGTETAIAIGSATLLSSLIGAGAAGLLGRAERRSLERLVEADRVMLDAHAGRGNVPEAVGAAATDTRTLELKGALGVERIPLGPFGNPLRRTFQSESIPARRIAADLAESPYTHAENVEGIATTQGGSVDRIARQNIEGGRVAVADELDKQFRDYRFGDPDIRAPRFRATVSRLLGRDEGKMTFDEFKREVSLAMQQGDTHELPQVTAAAQFIRREVFDRWSGERAEKAIEGYKRLEPKEGESFYPHAWNKSKIIEQRPEFTNKLVEKYKTDQDTRFAAAQRLEFSAAQLRSWEDEISKFERRLESLDQRHELLGARYAERAMEVRRGEKRAGVLEERAGSIAEEISQIEEFVAAMRPQLRDPEMLRRLDEMDREARELKRGDRPMTEAQLREVEQEELSGILATPEVRMASEIVTGRRKPPPRPNFVKWLVRAGGIEDEGGEVAAAVGGRSAVRGLIRKEAGAKFPGIGEQGRQGFHEIAERIVEENPGFFRDTGPPTRDDILRWISDSQQGREPEWLASLSADTPLYRADAMAQMLEEAFSRAGVEVKGVRDVAKILRDDRTAPMTLADLDRVVRDMEAVGEETPISIRREAAEDRLLAGREALADLRATIDKAKRASASRGRELGLAEARTGEAEFGTRQSKGRLGILDERMDAAERRRELIVDALEMAGRQRDEVRGKIEAELGNWEGKSALEAKSAIKAREKYAAETGRAPDAPRLTGADTAIDKTVRRILDSHRDYSIEELRARADQTVDRILGSPDGRLPYDEHLGGPVIGVEARPDLRGSQMHRQLDVSNAWARNWIEDDIEGVVARHLRTFIPDVLISERFGDVNMTNAIRTIEQDYADKINATPQNSKDRKRLHDERDQVIGDIAGMRDRNRGVFGWAPNMAKMARVTNSLKNLNNLTSMGVAAVSSLSDAAGSLFRFGLTNTFRDGWSPFFRNMVNPSEEWLKFRSQMRAVGIGTDTVINSRQHSLDDVMDVYKPQSRFERGLQAVSDKFFVANLLAPETDAMKTIAAHVAVSEILRASKAASAGKATARQITDLAASGIDRQMAERIASNFDQGGEVINGVHLPNTTDWTDQGAAQALNAAVGREVDIAVVTPGQEKALWLSRPVVSILGQFKSFTQSSTERILIANLQRRDARALQGLVAGVALGMMSYKLNSFFGGQKTSDRPQDWVKEGISRSGTLGWFEEANALAAKASRGSVDVYRLIGADKPLSRFASRSAADMLLGPTWSKIEGLKQITGASFAGEWGESDTKALRRLIAFQNLFYVRGLLNQVEEGANNAFGIEMKKKPQ